ncbi:MAG: M28 family peptidase [Flavobacteriales bacterium]
MTRHFLLLLLAAAVAAPNLSAQTLLHTEQGVPWSKSITPEDLSNHLHILAADSMEGRETGKPGQRKAAAYIAAHFESVGLKPVNGSYMQEVPLTVSQFKGGLFSIGDGQYVYKKDWIPYPGIEVSDVEGPAVFVGYGIQDEGWDDYAGVDVQGKVVIMLDGEPGNEKKGYTLTGTKEPSVWSSMRNAKREVADSLGASAVIVVTEEYATLKSRFMPWLTRDRMRLDVDREGEGTDVPTLLMAPEALLSMTGWKSLDVARKKWPKRKLDNTEWDTCKLALARMNDRVIAHNVWGMIPGSDSTLADEIVVLTSHYDHVGVDKTGDVFNGADDDGSGTVSLLENAEAWMQATQAGEGPRRTVLFIAFVGEEKGLLGSEWYSDHPAWPLEQHVCDLNMDMVGRVDEAHPDDDRYIYLIGSDKLSTELHDISEAVNSEHIGIALDYTFNAPDDPNRFYYRSDHYNFAKHDIPVIFYFSGVHEDYHGVGDTPDKILYPKMAEIGQLVFLTSWEVANRDKKLVVDVVNDFPSNR